MSRDHGQCQIRRQWLLVFAALTRTTMTFYSVPYMALGAELTSDYDERTLLVALRTVFKTTALPV